VLSPGLEIPHAAKDCTVYLHNLLFNNCLANVSGPLYQNNQVALTLGGQTLNVDLGPSALSIPDVERLIGEHLYADQSGMWEALTTAAEALGENVKLASPYELNWNHTIDVTAGIDAIPESDHLSESNIYLKPVTGWRRYPLHPLLKGRSASAVSVGSRGLRRDGFHHPARARSNQPRPPRHYASHLA
jgi:hypothetical protein